MTVSQTVKAALHAGDLDDSGHDAIENLVTAETDTTLVAAPDGAGGVEFRAETGGGSGLTVDDEGTPLTTSATTLDFVGAGVTASGTGATKTINIPGSGASSSTQISSTQTVIQDEMWFNANTDVYAGGVKRDISGTAANISGGSMEVNHPGVVQVSAGSTTTGRCALISLLEIALGNGQISCDVVLKTFGVSDGTNTYTAWSGFGDNPAGNPQDGVFFRYTHSVNSGKWQMCTANNNTITASDTGITVTDDTWYRLGFVVNAAGTSVEYFINGSSVGTVTTNIPTGTSRATQLMPANVVGSAGTGLRLVFVDAYWVLFTFTTPR